MLTTNQKGLVAETAVIHECVKAGIGVSRPLDDERYDLILDLRPQLVRIQCKWASRAGDVISVSTRTSRRGPTGHIHRSYLPGEIDGIAAFCLDNEKCYLLLGELCTERAFVQLRLGPTKNNQATGVRWARDFEFGATIRTLLGR
jgi:PD-(D/E)XK endonuclease